MKIFTAPKTYDSAISPYIRLYYASKNIPFAHNIGAAENSLSPFFSAHASPFPRRRKGQVFTTRNDSLTTHLYCRRRRAGWIRKLQLSRTREKELSIRMGFLRRGWLCMSRGVVRDYAQILGIRRQRIRRRSQRINNGTHYG